MATKLFLPLVEDVEILMQIQTEAAPSFFNVRRGGENHTVVRLHRECIAVSEILRFSLAVDPDTYHNSGENHIRGFDLTIVIETRSGKKYTAKGALAHMWYEALYGELLKAPAQIKDHVMCEENFVQKFTLKCE